MPRQQGEPGVSVRVRAVAVAVLLAVLVQTVGVVLDVLAQPPTPRLGVGLPVTLVRNVTLEPGDALAPHLYDFYFAGNDWGFLRVSHSDMWNPDNFTIVHVERYSHIPVTWDVHVFSKGDFNGYLLRFFWWAPGKYDFVLREPSGRLVGVNAGSLDFAVGRQYHVAVVFESYRFLRMYVDGELKGEATDVTVYQKTASDIYISGGHPYYPRGRYVSLTKFYNRSLTELEIQDSYSNGVVPAQGLLLFVDATFYNGVRPINLSHKPAPVHVHGATFRVPASSPLVYHIKGLHSDGLVHFRFFPLGSRAEFYAPDGSLVAGFVVGGSANSVGLVEDYAVSIQPGSYTLKVYTYQDATVYNLRR
jgi:hypothetical protein